MVSVARIVTRLGRIARVGLVPFTLIAGHEDIAERVREFRIAKLLLKHPLDSLARILVVTSSVTSRDDMLYAPR